MRHREMFDRLKAKQALRNLRNKKWIEDRENGEKVEFRLTEKGKEGLFRLKTKQEIKELQFEQSCIVVFDFPIGANKARDKFRYYLKQSGFKLMQDSVWVTKKDMVAHMQSLVELLDISKWVRIIVGRDVTF